MLTLIATPLGNLADISIRALSALFSVDILLCEDTRRTGLLLHELKTRYASLLPTVKKDAKLVSFYDEVEFKKVPEIITDLESGVEIGLVSDNGMPLISDPGFLLVREARKRGISVTVIPGPSAAITALASSGLPTQPHTFVGFLPEKEMARKKVLSSLLESAQSINATYILYCAPHKLETTLQDMQSVFGDIEIVILRELTKLHEAYHSGKISELTPQSTEMKGELVLLFRLPIR